MRDLAALEVGEAAERGVGAHDREQPIPGRAALRADDHERHGAGEIDREAHRAGGEQRDMQPAGAECLDLRGIGLHRKIHHALAGAAPEMVHQRRVDMLVDRRILGRRIGEDQRRRILVPCRIARRVGDEIAIGVAIERVEFAAIGAGILRRHGCAPAEQG